MSFVWVESDAVCILHDEMLARTGGNPGVNDLRLLMSALNRPVNQYAYTGEADVAVLAAWYLIGVAKAHAFNDCNKRTAWLVVNMFLALNSVALADVSDDEAVEICLIAAQDAPLSDIAAWFRRRM